MHPSPHPPQPSALPRPSRPPAPVMAERGRKARPCLLCLPSCRSYDKQRCANTCVAAGVARTRPIPGAKVVGVRRGGGGASLPPWPVSLGASPSFDFLSTGLEVAPVLRGLLALGKWLPPVPRHPLALGVGAAHGWEWGRGGSHPQVCIAFPPHRASVSPGGRLSGLGKLRQGREGWGPRRGGGRCLTWALAAAAGSAAPGHGDES